MVLAIFAMLLSQRALAQTLPYQDKTLSFHERAKDLVSRMTLEEKINQVGHKTAAITRLGLQGYNYWNEALHGVARSGVATSFPSSKAMSATWDLPLIYDCANATSDEARIYNNTKNKGLIYWCPTINMSRDPRWGRDEENYGEDPYLTGRIAVEYIRAMQGEGDKYFKTVATAKHFACNNYEKGRHSTSSEVDERNLREYYLPAFETAVKEANVRSIMSAYNAVNGTPCGANHELLIDILRNEWGFTGFVTSDCGAVEDIYNKHHYVTTAAQACGAAMPNGEDLNCGNTFQDACMEAINGSLLREADLDSALVRVLEARFSVGEFDSPSDVKWTNVDANKLDCQEHRNLALKAAQEAIVLLKNDNNFLPLDKTKSVAVIGPLGHTISLGGYSGTPTDLTTAFEGIAAKVGYSVNDGVLQFEKCDEQSVPSEAKRLTHESNGSAGNMGYIYNNDWVAFNSVNFGGGKTKVTICHGAKNSNPTTAKLYLDAINGSPLATVICPVTGNWAKYVETTVDIDANLFRGIHKLYVEFEGGTNGDRYCANMDWIKFTNPNTANPLEEDGPAYFYQGCTVNDKSATNVERAKEIAQKADVVVFAAGTNLDVSDESNDRTSLNLPGDQQALLEAVYSVNPNVVLLLQTCSSVTIPWAKENCKAIVEAWYDGQAQGKAIADVLYGDVNPSGKLTSTWYASQSDLPSGMLEYDIRKAGYTYMYHQKEPLYPFGFGMSYTTFEYSNLAIDKATLNKGEEANVTFSITNTGDRDGAEVAQLYIHANSDIDRPIKQLVGFQRVELKAGETKSVTLPIKHEQLAYFNAESHTFDVEQGAVDVMVGASSKDIRLNGKLQTEAATVKTTYKSQPTGINKTTIDKAQNNKVYNVMGVCVGEETDFDNLPKGFYIVNGKKRIKRII